MPTWEERTFQPGALTSDNAEKIVVAANVVCLAYVTIVLLAIVRYRKVSTTRRRCFAASS